MRKRDRLAIAQALKNAKPYLSHGNDNKEEFICFSIELGVQRIPQHRAARLAKHVIMERLDGCFTAEDWLKYTVGIAAVNRAGFVALQAWRHRWLDSLIEEFSK